MAEGRPASSLEEPAKPKSSRKEKRPHQTEGKKVKTPALRLSEVQQEPPAAALKTTSSEDKEQYLDTVSAEASELSLLSISDYQEESDQPQPHTSSRSPSPPTLSSTTIPLEKPLPRTDPPSLEEPAKPKSSQKEKRPHQTEGKEVETPALHLSEAQQEPPAAALQATSSEDKEQYLDTVSAEVSEISLISKSDPQQESDQAQSQTSSSCPSSPLRGWNEPIIKIFRLKWKEPRIKVSRSGCSVKVSTEYQGKPSLEVISTAENPLLRTERPRSMPILGYTYEAGSKAKGEGVVHGSVRAIKQRWNPACIPSAEPAREAATKLYQTQEFLQIRQLPKPTPEVS